MSIIDEKHLCDETLYDKTRIGYLAKENNWKYMSSSLIQEWRIARIKNMSSCKCIINKIEINPTSTTDTHFVFNFKQLRSKWFDLFGDTERECDLLALENECMYALLGALQHYSQAPSDLTNGCIFTPAFEIFFVFGWKARTNTENDVRRIEIEEKYVESDVQINKLK